MTGEQLADLMTNDYLKGSLARHARRYSKRVEDQEEYIQDAWIRISQQPGDKTLEYYEEQGRKAILASWQKARRQRVYTKKPRNVYGDNEGKSKKPPRNSVQIDRNKYLMQKPHRLSAWYYHGEWDDYGYAKDEIARSEWFQIIVIE